jgi:magnesium chelatase family protein
LINSPTKAEYSGYTQPVSSLLLEDIVGQRDAKQALIVAAAGGHHVLLVGPPGQGKSALAKRMSSILPPMTREEMIEVSVIHQSAGLADWLIQERPVRMIDPGITRQALVGGGSTNPRPGEVSLAHRGVLFVDEMLQFTRDKLDALRGPLQDGYVSVSRVDFKTTFPARFQVIAATNPCPCGYKGSPKPCTCTKRLLTEYPKRLSGALFDRIPIRIKMDCASGYDVVGGVDTSGITTDGAKGCILRARAAQSKRYDGTPVMCNNEIEASTLHFLDVHPTAHDYLGDQPWMSPREMEAVLRVGRTVSDMRGGSQITDDDVRQALAIVLEAENLFG